MTNKQSIAFQGAPGAFSHAAAIAFAERLGVEASFDSCQTFGDVFAEVVSGNVTYGAIPLENSTIGSIVANYDLLWEHDAVIIAEHSLPVHHQLIGFPESRIEDLKLVFSHPAALDQCRKLFKEHSNIAPRVHWDTSGSVAHVKENGDRTLAAIAGPLAAKEYGMSILKADIEDFTSNATRFGLITRFTDGEMPQPLRSQTDASSSSNSAFKQSFAVELTHEVGALAKLVSAISVAGANLTKIESRPIGETPWHYRFFLDIEVGSERMENELESALRIASIRYKALGRYIPALSQVAAR